jgi:hypothetical protein
MFQDGNYKSWKRSAGTCYHWIRSFKSSTVQTSGASFREYLVKIGKFSAVIVFPLLFHAKIEAKHKWVHKI